MRDTPFETAAELKPKPDPAAPSEDVNDESDVVPASKRILRRIMDEELDKFLKTLSNGRRRLCDVLDRLGEKTLSESFQKAFKLTGSFVEPAFVHANNSISNYGAIFFFGLNELPDGTITDSKDRLWNTPNETVATEADIAPAARRLMKRILSGSRRFRMKMELNGFVARRILSDD